MKVSVNNLKKSTPKPVEVVTTKLNNGAVVLAKPAKAGERPWAYTFINNTQATNKVDVLKGQGIDCYVYQPYLGRVFYVAMGKGE